MSRSLPVARAASAFISSEVSAFVARRGYAASASPGVVSKSGAPAVMMKKGSEETGKTAWVPDPVTGYYRPESAKKPAMDPVEQRAMLINNETGGNE